MTSFRDQVIWITGGGSGIGRALAVAFAADGAAVAVSGRRIEPLEDTVAAIEQAGGRGLAVPLDVTDEDAVFAAAEEVVEHFGRLDVVVANAGFSVAGRVAKLSAEDWRRQFDVNVVGLTSTARAALPHLEATAGRLVFIGSVMAYIGAPGTGAYAASKFAVRAIGESMAMELHGTGVSVTTIHPGFVESDIARVSNDNQLKPGAKDPRPAKLMWPADRAARVMKRAIARRKRQFVFTGHGRAAALIGRWFPGLVYFAVTRGSKRSG